MKQAYLADEIFTGTDTLNRQALLIENNGSAASFRQIRCLPDIPCITIRAA